MDELDYNCREYEFERHLVPLIDWFVAGEIPYLLIRNQAERGPNYEHTKQWYTNAPSNPMIFLKWPLIRSIYKTIAADQHLDDNIFDLSAKQSIVETGGRPKETRSLPLDT